MHLEPLQKVVQVQVLGAVHVPPFRQDRVQTATKYPHTEMIVALRHNTYVLCMLIQTMTTYRYKYLEPYKYHHFDRMKHIQLKDNKEQI